MTPSPRVFARSLASTALLLLTILTSGVSAQQAGDSPVRIFILAGQSNMLGQGEISPVTTPGTLEYIVANDPGGDYQFLVDGGGGWVERDDVWIRDQDPSLGGLTVGYGSQPTRIGPELGFGHHLGDLYENQILIVKASWGGKSLAVDFRPPSSGGTTGFYYNEILRLVNEATSNLGTYFSDYNTTGGYEIAGFGWHQGWNDRVSPTNSAEYETNMANFIRDIRTDLGAPNMPFVIASSAMDAGSTYTQVEQAQLAMGNATLYLEFDGNVAVVDTRTSYEDLEFWQPEEQSPKSEGYHWNRNAKTYVNMGLAMGDAMSLLAPGRCPFRPRASGEPAGVVLSWENGTETPTSVQILRNGFEIAASAPASPSTFTDTSAEPGILNYQLVFTMAGDPCDPLTTTLNGGVTGLRISPQGGDLVLTWNNNMAYDGIEIKRDGVTIEASLSGTTSTYTDTSAPSQGVVVYTVAPTNGSSSPAAAQINLDLAGQLGRLDLALANGGINPATGSAWALGDQYRLAFVTSTGTQATSTDINTYNTFVQGLANTAGLGDGTWKVLGSTATMEARNNTATNPNTDGTGVAIFLVDGVTKVADNNIDLWNGNLDAAINMNEIGTGGLSGSVFGGSDTDGTGRGSGGPDERVLGGSNDETPPKVTIGDMAQTSGQWMVIYNAGHESSLPVYALSDPLTIIDGADNTPPTLTSIADNKSGGPVVIAEAVTYTVTFSEAMKASTIDTGDFENASATAITVNSVTPTGNPAVFEILVTPLQQGTLQLRVTGSASLEDAAGNALDAANALPDDTIITVDTETIPPTLDSFADDVGGGPVLVDTVITYTVSFSEAMNASTVEIGDFENASPGAITVNSVTPTGNPAVFEISVTATAAGSLQLRVASSAILEDIAGNSLVTGSAAPDDTIITVAAPPDLVGELGVLNVALANGGINPATGSPWAEGNTYRLAFVTSTTTTAETSDIGVYNDFVQSVAAGSANYPDLGNGIWKVIGSTAGTSAKENTETDSGTGVAVILLDGLTVFANNNGDIWNGSPLRSPGLFMSPYFDEEGDEVTSDTSAFTGSVSGGTQSNDRVLGSTDAADNFRVTTGKVRPNNGSRWMQQFNSAKTNSLRVFAMSLPLTIQATDSGLSAFDTWTDSVGLDGTVGKENGQGDDPDGGGRNNLYEFALGGDPLDATDDGTLLHAFSDNVAGGAEDEGILTILVRSGANFSDGAPAVSAAVDGIIYTVSADSTLAVAGSVTVTGTAPVTTGLPPAPAGYEYASFYISGPEGYFQVTVTPAP